jgi:hypothetical protein
MFTTLDSEQARDYIMAVTINKDDKLVYMKIKKSDMCNSNADYWKNKEYIATVKKYQDENGNTYHAVRLVRFSDNDEIRFKKYGYGDHYKTTTVEEMQKTDWINSYDDYSLTSRHELMNAQQDVIHFEDIGYVKEMNMLEWSQW